MTTNKKLNERRKKRYREDPAYRAKVIANAKAQKAKAKARREAEKNMRGWSPIETAPNNEVIFLYDPRIFWPVLGERRATHDRFRGLHYQGPIEPTHWCRPMKVPKQLPGDSK